MTRPIAVLRPEPGAAATSARAEALGFATIRLPLFEVRPLAWTPPDPDLFDGLLLTSANAVRHAGPELARFRDLPVHAVGAATAREAARAGLTIAAVGKGGAADLLARTQARRLLHLCAEEARAAGPPVARTLPVYRSEPLAIPPEQLRALAGAVALLHSPRAGRRLAELVGAEDRARIRLATLSRAVADAAGEGWDRVEIAASISDGALLAAASALAD